MQSWNGLPRRRLTSSGDVNAEFLALDIDDYRAAAHRISQLPYGRNSDRANFRLVLSEGRGTCSTKHALLAALATEQGLAVQLTLGIYQMHGRNTPGVGALLDKYGLAFVPEAHCYLTYDRNRIDVTRGSITPAEPVTSFFHEETISPAQIGDYKVQMHKKFIREWSARALPGRSWEEIWKIREECIAALNQSGQSS